MKDNFNPYQDFSNAEKLQNMMPMMGNVPLTQIPFPEPSMMMPQAGGPMMPGMPMMDPNMMQPMAPPLPETFTNTMYLPGYLRTQIGRLVNVNFLIGTQLVDRAGILTQIGDSYIVLRPLAEKFDVVCDLYSIKFVTVLDPNINPNFVVMV